MKNSILVILLLVGVGILGYLFINKQNQDNLMPNEEENNQTTPTQNSNQGSSVNTVPTQTTPTFTNTSNNSLDNGSSNFECSNNPNSQGDDTNGCHPGLITSVSGSVNNYSLTIDYVILDTCPPLNPGDECLVNNNPMIRTFPISNSATVKIFNSEWQPINIDLQNFVSNFSTGTGVAPNTMQDETMYKLNKIKIENGVVVEISPIYLP